jgi:hypothetical protein
LLITLPLDIMFWCSRVPEVEFFRVGGLFRV